MNSDAILGNLNLLQLTTMLKHIRLGRGHLEKHLGSKTFQKLLELSSVSKKAKDKIKTDMQEHAGNIALVLNTIITGILGSWLGFAGFVDLHLNSLGAFIFLIFVLMGVCGWIGFISFKLTVTKAKQILISKKLHLIELDILEYIEKVRQKDLKKCIKNIIKQLELMAPEWLKNSKKKRALVQALKEDTDYTNAYTLLEELITDAIPIKKVKSLDPLLKSKIEKTFAQMKRLCEELAAHKEIDQETAKAETNSGDAQDYMLNRSLTGANTYIKILTTPGLEVETTPQTPYKWLRKNSVAVMTGLAPTLCGGFASMFVFLGGIPQFLEEFQITKLKPLIHHELSLQIIGISIAACLTIYYCYSYIHSTYKSYFREKEVEKTECEIVEQNEVVSKLNMRFNFYTELNKIIEEFTFIYLLRKPKNATAVN